jgi:ubiquitin carboxyl-terminal hydrolase 14
MSAFTVHIKHEGKQQSLQLDPEQPPSVFKEAIYQVTGVPVDRMKVMIKGALLKVSIVNLRGTTSVTLFVL